MTENATGIVLRTIAFSETSTIVHWLCQEQGRLNTIVKGARKPGSAFRGKVDLFYVADFSFARSRNSDLHVLRELSLRELHAGLRRDVRHLQQASYCANFIEQSTELESPIRGVYELLIGFLGHTSSRQPQRRSVFAFELKMLQELGLGPNVEGSKLSAEASQLMLALLNDDWEEIANVSATRQAALEIRNFLHGYLIYHLGKLPKGREQALS